LNNNYPLTKRKIIKKLDLRNKNLEGELDLSDFANLEELDCSNNSLTSLNLKCPQLNSLICSCNFFSNCDFLKKLEPEQLTELVLSDNNFFEQDLSCFSIFSNLIVLDISNNDKERIRNNIYNRFTGSLKLLSGISELRSLSISNTDITEGFEDLPDVLDNFLCESQKRESKCQKIVKKLAKETYQVNSPP